MSNKRSKEILHINQLWCLMIGTGILITFSDQSATDHRGNTIAIDSRTIGNREPLTIRLVDEESRQYNLAIEPDYNYADFLRHAVSLVVGSTIDASDYRLFEPDGEALTPKRWIKILTSSTPQLHIFHLKAEVRDETEGELIYAPMPPATRRPSFLGRSRARARRTLSKELMPFKRQVEQGATAVRMTTRRHGSYSHGLAQLKRLRMNPMSLRDPSGKVADFKTTSTGQLQNLAPPREPADEKAPRRHASRPGTYGGESMALVKYNPGGVGKYGRMDKFSGHSPERVPKYLRSESRQRADSSYGSSPQPRQPRTISISPPGRTSGSDPNKSLARYGWGSGDTKNSQLYNPAVGSVSLPPPRGEPMPFSFGSTYPYNSPYPTLNTLYRTHAPFDLSPLHQSVSIGAEGTESNEKQERHLAAEQAMVLAWRNSTMMAIDGPVSARPSQSPDRERSSQSQNIARLTETGTVFNDEDYAKEDHDPELFDVGELSDTEVGEADNDDGDAQVGVMPVFSCVADMTDRTATQAYSKN